MNIRMVRPIQLGVVALVAGGFFAFLTLRETPAKTPAKVETSRIVSRAGGFSVGVPQGLSASKRGTTVQLASKDKDLVVTVGPARSGSLTDSSKAFVESLSSGYSEVHVLGHESQKVDGRRALATFGQAVNSKSVKIRFVSVAVSARPHDFTINAFTGFDTDPRVELPRVNAIVDTFKVLSPAN